MPGAPVVPAEAAGPPSPGTAAIASGREMPEGATISAGEQAEIRGGVPLSDSGRGESAPADYPPPSDSGLVIPNGDGTSTVIAPDGTTRTVKGTPAAPEPAVAPR